MASLDVDLLSSRSKTQSTSEKALMEIGTPIVAA